MKARVVQPDHVIVVMPRPDKSAQALLRAIGAKHVMTYVRRWPSPPNSTVPPDDSNALALWSMRVTVIRDGRIEHGDQVLAVRHTGPAFTSTTTTMPADARESDTLHPMRPRLVRDWCF